MMPINSSSSSREEEQLMSSSTSPTMARRRTVLSDVESHQQHSSFLEEVEEEARYLLDDNNNHNSFYDDTSAADRVNNRQGLGGGGNAAAAAAVVSTKASSSSSSSAASSASAVARTASSDSSSTTTTSGSEDYKCCRICLEEVSEEELASGEAIYLECACRGNNALRHKACAERWAAVKGDTTCEVCGKTVGNLPPVETLPPPSEFLIEPSHQITGIPPELADDAVAFVQCLRTTWIMLILFVLILDMDSTDALFLAGTCGLLAAMLTNIFTTLRRIHRNNTTATMMGHGDIEQGGGGGDPRLSGETGGDAESISTSPTHARRFSFPAILGFQPGVERRPSLLTNIMWVRGL